MYTCKRKLGGNNYLIIDLNQPLTLETEVYPGDPKPERIVFSDIRKTGWHHFIYRIGDHHFHPHCDAPKHQNPDMQDKGVEIFGLNYCFNSAFLINLSGSSETQEFDSIKYLVEVKKDHLKSFEHLLSKKGAVLIRTGYDKWLEANKPHTPPNIPYLTGEAAKYLAGFDNLRVVGIDSITVDACGREEPVHVSHQSLKDKLIVESLVHLYKIPKDKRKGFDLQTTPVKIVGATGAPVVAYVYIRL